MLWGEASIDQEQSGTNRSHIFLFAHAKPAVVLSPQELFGAVTCVFVEYQEL
jgi:hypothetical protein